MHSFLSLHKKEEANFPRVFGHMQQVSKSWPGYLLFRQQVGIQHRWAGRRHLCQGHDVLEGNVSLGACVYQLRL